MSVKANPIPTIDELKNALYEAQEALGVTRAEVFDGKADADDLAKAEAAVTFARTRLEGVEEARYRHRQVYFEKRAPEIASELKELQPKLEELKAREATIREAVLDYRDLQLEIQDEIRGAHAELASIRDGDRTKSILKKNQIRITLNGYVAVGDASYGSIPIDRLLTDLGVETSRPIKRPVAQRPPRRKKEAA